MNNAILLFVILFSSQPGRNLTIDQNPLKPDIFYELQDSARSRQYLYNGQFWRNPYHRIKGHPFFSADAFLQGTIKVNGHTFEDVRLKLDLCTDQLLIQKNVNEIIQVNKEMTDFFTLASENKVYRFIRTNVNTSQYFTGYVNELYKGKSALYVKYVKEVVNIINGPWLGNFDSFRRIFVLKDDKVWQVKNLGDLSKVFGLDKSILRSFTKKNKLRVTNRDPESFIPVLNYLDSFMGK